MTECNGIGTPILDIDRERIISGHTAPLDEKDHKSYQHIIGSLLYVMHCTRPDLAYTIIRLAQYSAHPERHHWEALKRLLRYVKATRHATLRLGPFSDLPLVGYFDSAHADGRERRSTEGYVFLFYGSLISWQSKVQRVIALSTTEAEFMAASEAGREVLWIRGLLNDMNRKMDKPTMLYRDNTGTNALAHNPEFHHRTKHIQLRLRFITSLVQDKVVDVTYVPSNAMLADGLTKPLTKDTHALHWETISLSLNYESPLDRKRKLADITR